MKLYNILIKKNRDAIDDVILLNDGFCLTAFLFSALWFLFHKMWHEAAIIFAVNYALQTLLGAWLLSDINAALCEMAFMLVVAYSANSWLSKHLLKQGYKIAGFVLAHNKAEARIKAVELLQDQNPQLSIDELSEAVIDPRAYRKSLKQEIPYFWV